MSRGAGGDVRGPQTLPLLEAKGSSPAGGRVDKPRAQLCTAKANPTVKRDPRELKLLEADHGCIRKRKVKYPIALTVPSWGASLCLQPPTPCRVRQTVQAWVLLLTHWPGPWSGHCWPLVCSWCMWTRGEKLRWFEFPWCCNQASAPWRVFKNPSCRPGGPSTRHWNP